MIRATAIDLISVPETAGVYDTAAETTRRVFAEVRSVGYREFYEAQEQGLEPSIVFVLADYAEYKNERFIDYDGARYRVIRSYVDRERIQLTAERAKA